MTRRSLLLAGTGLPLLLCVATSSAHAQAVPAGAERIVASHSGLCLSIKDESMSRGAKLEQATCNGATSRQWKFVPVGGNAYHIVNVKSGLCVDATLKHKHANAMIQWTCSGATHQKWTFERLDRRWVIKNAFTDQCLDVMGFRRGPKADILQYDCHKYANQRFSLINKEKSEWSPRLDFGFVPVSAAHLPDARLILWSASTKTAFYGPGSGFATYTSLLNVLPSVSVTSPSLTRDPGEVFCQGSALLPSGALLVAGGSSLARTSIFDGSWKNEDSLNIARGYNSVVTLANGTVFTLGGSWSGKTDSNRPGELWTKAAGWKKLNVPAKSFATNDPEDRQLGYGYRSDNQMWLFANKGSWVFHAGPSKKMHWVDTANNGSVVPAGARANDTDSMNGNAVLFDTDKILTVGGAPSYSGGMPASQHAHLIDISAGPGRMPKVTKLDDMAYRRGYSNAVVLPNGQVVVIGGMAKPVAFTDTDSSLTPELFDPHTLKFTKLKPMSIPRNYHSVAMLLPDGRVLSAGGGLCGEDCAANHPNGEILSPPYLFNDDGTPASRPSIVSAPSRASAGATIQVEAKDVVSFSLVRMSSTTHTINTDQRRLPLDKQSWNLDGAFRLKIPARDEGAIPGKYMLFAIGDLGTPSFAKIIQIE
ncbi:MAG: RICIN domain-containing protein [Beijerinckiaceae bacterium]|nr:RICIN domain-containing protein [Beijerinckiaceae bacterium]